MKFLTIFSTLLASGTALAAYVPQANTARGLSSGIQTGAEEHANPIESFFDEIKHTITPDDETEEKLASRDLVDNMFNLVGTVSFQSSPSMISTNTASERHRLQ
jgi:hypothetical protein